MSEEKTKKKEIKKLTDGEIEEYLKSSILIPKDKWKDLQDNSQISYFKKDGGFVKSGFIKLIYTKEDEDYIRYGSKLGAYHGDKYYREFTVKFSNIDKLYKRIDQGAITEYKLIKENINQILLKYTERIDELEVKLNKANDDITRTLNLVKKLHKIENLNDLKKILG